MSYGEKNTIVYFNGEAPFCFCPNHVLGAQILKTIFGYYFVYPYFYVYGQRRWYSNPYESMMSIAYSLFLLRSYYICSRLWLRKCLLQGREPFKIRVAVKSVKR